MNSLNSAVFSIATALASAFGPMPEESIIVDATIGKEGVGTPYKVIENFLADSRQFLDL